MQISYCHQFGDNTDEVATREADGKKDLHDDRRIEDKAEENSLGSAPHPPPTLDAVVSDRRS